MVPVSSSRDIQRMNTRIDEAISRALRSFPNVRSLKQEQKLVIYKIIEKQDVFAELPTGFGKSLTYQLLPGIYNGFSDLGVENVPQKPVVVVVCPLNSIIKDQVEYLRRNGIPATFVGESEDSDKVLIDGTGNFSLVFGSPELLVGNETFRNMFENRYFQENTVALVCDEVHTVVQWGETQKRNKDPFRKWCGLVGELRSLLPEKVPVLALTATATPSTRKNVCRSLAMQKCFEIIVSPNRDNIRLHVKKVESKDFEQNFTWLLEEIKNKKVDCPRVVIYTQSITMCSGIYKFLVLRLKKNAFWPPGAREIAKNRIVAMYHSGTDPEIQKFVLTSLSSTDGTIRVVVATSALGMGVDMKDLHLIVHFGPPSDIKSYVQQMGRAGRDGKQSDAVLLYCGEQLRLCGPEMLNYLKSDVCRRKTLIGTFHDTENVEALGHLCCDNCAHNCSCGLDNCKWVQPIPEICQNSDDNPMKNVRVVTETEKQQLLSKLKECQLQCRQDALLSNQYAFYHDIDLLVHFPDSLIQDVVDKCQNLFTIGDILELEYVWSFEHAKRIFGCLEDTFPDILYSDREDLELI